MSNAHSLIFFTLIGSVCDVYTSKTFNCPVTARHECRERNKKLIMIGQRGTENFSTSVPPVSELNKSQIESNQQTTVSKVNTKSLHCGLVSARGCGSLARARVLIS